MLNVFFQIGSRILIYSEGSRIAASSVEITVPIPLSSLAGTTLDDEKGLSNGPPYWYKRYPAPTKAPVITK